MAKPKAPLADRSAVKVVATNRAARHDYAIDERFEAGIALLGTEVKSIREGGANLREGYVQVRGGEAFLVNTHIAPYDPAGRTGHDPLRSRKLLLHKKEIARLETGTRERGWTVIPLRMYLKNGRLKIEIALARGKRQFDKRQAIAKRDAERQIDRSLKERRS
ncbi:MAG TPA: SsrA-binding protein SmpB [Anaerolineae bacterium]|nr:SsrA-binding protein SmpB [Anaerolineae bacterium]